MNIYNINLNVFLDIRCVVGDNESIGKVSAFNLHKAVGRVADTTRQQSALEHGVYYRAFAI